MVAAPDGPAARAAGGADGAAARQADPAAVRHGRAPDGSRGAARSDRAALSDKNRSAQTRERARRRQHPAVLARPARRADRGCSGRPSGRAARGRRRSRRRRPDRQETAPPQTPPPAPPPPSRRAPLPTPRPPMSRTERHASGRATAAGRRARRGAAEPESLRPESAVRESERQGRVRTLDPVRHQGRRVRSVDPPLRGAGETQLVRALRGDVAARPRRPDLQRPQGRPHHRPADCAAIDVDAFNNAAFNALTSSNPTMPLPTEYPVGPGLLHRHLLLQRDAAAVSPTACSSDPHRSCSRSWPTSWLRLW